MSDILTPKSQASSVPSTRPFDVIELPSKGKVYSHPELKGLEKVECYYLTAKEEDILTSPNLIKSGDLFDTLLKSILKTRIPVDKLTLGDRNAILIWSRINAYGKDYAVKMLCPNCNQMFDNTFDLSLLDIKGLEHEPDENGLFTLPPLPRTNAVVKIRLMTGEIEKQIFLIERARNEKLNNKLSNKIILRLQRLVAEVNGSSDQTQISAFIENLPIEDSRFIRTHIQEIEPSVIMKQNAVCSNCGVSSEVDVPMAENFFWPDL